MLPPDPILTLEPAVIDFYAMGSPNVVNIYIALEEMGTLVFFPAGQGKYGKKSHRNRSRYQKRPNSSDT
jgi:hypothetical protein